MSENNEEQRPYVDPNSGAAPQPGGFASAAPVAVSEGGEPAGGGKDYSELLSGSVKDVQGHIEKNPDEKDAIIAAEKKGENRKGIVEA